MSCTSSDLNKTTAKFEKDLAKTVGGVAFTRLYPVSNCFKPKNDLARTAKKVTKN